MKTTDITQAEKAEKMAELHRRPGIFVIPNPWDAGSAKILASLGFEALTTTSAGLAFSLGKPDGLGVVTLEETLKNARDIVEATDLPVAADLENGFGDSPEACAQTILAAAGVGLVGGSIEDATGNPDEPIYPFELALERIKAAVKAARTLPFHFTLTTRAENFLHGRNDLEDTIKRLVAFADAGADVLFAPGLNTEADIAAVVKAVAPKPVSVVMGLGKSDFTVDGLGRLGVKRISLGSALVRAAYSSFIGGAKEIKEQGTFNFSANTVPYADFNRLFEL